MLRAAVLGTVTAALALGGCGDNASDESRPAATATATAPAGYYEAMDALVTRLDGEVAAAIAGDADATTAASARDYARNGDRAGLKLIRRIPIVETRDALKSEAGG